MWNLTAQQILAIDAFVDVKIAKLGVIDDPGFRRELYLSFAKEHARNHNIDMVKISLMAGGVPQEEVTAIFALIL